MTEVNSSKIYVQQTTNEPGSNNLQPVKSEKPSGAIFEGQRYSDWNILQPDINTYGGDIANFIHFKGNDKNDAMRMTNIAANDVKNAYMQLQHEFKDVDFDLAFEPMPDPTLCGKKREGFFNYQQELEVWKNRALTQIANARENSTVEIARAVVGAVNENTEEKATKVMDNDNYNAKQIMDNDNCNAAKVIDNNNYNTKQIGCEVIQTAGAMINIIQNEGEATRNAVQDEGEATRNTVQDEGEATRNTVQAQGKQTREQMQEEADRIIDTLDPAHIKRAIKSVRDAAIRAGESIEDFIKNHPDEIVAFLGGITSYGVASIVIRKFL